MIMKRSWNIRTLRHTLRVVYVHEPFHPLEPFLKFWGTSPSQKYYSPSPSISLCLLVPIFQNYQLTVVLNFLSDSHIKLLNIYTLNLWFFSFFVFKIFIVSGRLVLKKDIQRNLWDFHAYCNLQAIHVMMHTTCQLFLLLVFRFREILKFQTYWLEQTMG